MVQQQHVLSFRTDMSKDDK